MTTLEANSSYTKNVTASPGTYKLLALAGYETASQVSLLGTASTSVTVTAGNTSTASLTLQAVTETLYVSASSVSAGGDYYMELLFDCGLASVCVDNSSNAPSIDLANSSGTSVATITCTSAGPDGTPSYIWYDSLTAPSTVDTYTATVSGTSTLTFINDLASGASGISMTNANGFLYTWGLLRDSDLSGVGLSKTLDVAAATGIGVTLGWGS